MKNATATSHGNSRLAEADGAAGSEGIWPEGGEWDELYGMELKNYFTNEYGNLLEYIATLRIVPSIVLHCFLWVFSPRLLVITCTKACPWPFPFTPFLLR
jgi:hypothetical protein